jgi:hypothetical protein
MNTGTILANVYFVNASAETYTVNILSNSELIWGCSNLVIWQLTYWASNFGDVMDLEIKFNNWVSSNIEPIENGHQVWLFLHKFDLKHHELIDKLGDLKCNVGGNRSPRRKPTLSERVASLAHEEWVWPGIEPTTSEVAGADIYFEHRSYTTAPLWQWQP